MPSPLTHCLLHPVRHKKASKCTTQSTTGNAYVVGGYRDDTWDPDCPRPSMPFVPLSARMFLLGLSPPPLWVVHGRPAFDRACKAVWGREEWAIVLLLLSGPAPDADECPVPEVVRMDKVPHDPHVAVTSLREGGAVEQGTVVVYQPSHSTAVWGAKYTTALDAIKSIGGCDVHWRPHAVYRPHTALSPELTAFNAESLRRVVQSPHSDLA